MQLQEGLIDTIYQSVSATAVFSDVSSALGPSVACSQLVALAQSIDLAVGRLSDLGGIEFGDAHLLRKIDVSLVRLPTIGSQFSSCNSTSTLNFDALKSSLLDVKAQVLSQLLDGLDPGT
jgi:hypothetical protein